MRKIFVVFTLLNIFLFISETVSKCLEHLHYTLIKELHSLEIMKTRIFVWLTFKSNIKYKNLMYSCDNNVNQETFWEPYWHWWQCPLHISMTHYISIFIKKNIKRTVPDISSSASKHNIIIKKEFYTWKKEVLHFKFF